MDGCDELIYYSDLSVSEEGQQDGGAGSERERERRPWLLMRVYHNDTTFLMHLSYEDLHKYTNTRGRVMHRCVSRH